MNVPDSPAEVRFSILADSLTVGWNSKHRREHEIYLAVILRTAPVEEMRSTLP